MADVDFQQLSTVQNLGMPKPTTVAATTTIAPTTFLTFVTGSTAVTTITPFVTGSHMLMFVFTATNGSITTAGNIANALSPAQNVPVVAVFDPNSAKYYVK